jgi:hypothetical protein
MQLTRFDRWLREKFVYELHIHTLRPSPALPRGVREYNLPEVPGMRFRHLYVATSVKAGDAFITLLKENNQMYKAEIVDRRSWYVPFVAPKEKSVTWWFFSTVIISISVFFILSYLKYLWMNEDFRKNFLEAIEIMKG